MFRMAIAAAALAVMTAGPAAAVSDPASAQDRVVFKHAGKRGTPCEGLPGCTFVQLKGNPRTGPSEAMFTLKAGTPFAPHWHTSPEHVVGVSGTMLWNVKGHKTYRVGAGDFLYYPSKAVHSGRCAPGADCVYYVYDSEPYDIHPAER